MIPTIKTNSGFHAMVNGDPYEVNKTHENYEELLQASRDGDVDSFLDLFSVERKVDRHFEETNVQVEGGVVTYKGTPVQNTLTDMIVDMSEEGEDPEYMVHFLDNLMENPSKRAVDELYDFLANRGMPLTEDGCFLAYKSVQSNFLDKYSSTFDNSVGQVHEMPRNQVDDNASNTCSKGFHVGAFAYAGPGGWYNNHNDRVMLVKINPRDAVSVPSDHSAQKLRVCRYEVIAEHESTKELDEVVWKEEEPEEDEEILLTDEVEEEDNYDAKYYTPQ